MIDMGLSSIVNPPLVIIMDYLSIKISLMQCLKCQWQAGGTPQQWWSINHDHGGSLSHRVIECSDWTEIR